MRKILLCLFTAFLPWVSRAQDDHIVKAALFLSGAATEEEIPSDWIDRLESVRIQRINSDRLTAGTLLTDYQVACIRDYRARSGDILSWEELSLVDGFSPEAVSALKPFLSLYSDRLPGAADTSTVHASALVRTTLNSVGMKAKASGEYWRAGGAWRGKEWSAYAEGRIRRGRFLLGDFHTRWGQGLAAWTGFSMTSLSTVDAFVKRAGGLSPSGSYSPSSALRGVAAEYGGRRLRASAYAAPGHSYGVHVDYLWRNGQVGVTSLVTNRVWSFSLDGKYNRKGVVLSGEAAYRNRSFAGNLSIRGKAGEDGKWALQGRLIPSRYSGKKNGEYALAAGFSYRKRDAGEFSITADAALLPLPGTDPRRFQLRVYGIWQLTISSAWLLDIRFTERYRNYEAPRTDFRIDIKADFSPWLGVLRAEADFCGKWGCLGYLESGYKTEKTAAYLRLTGFWIPQWSARIYTYERDAPGTFSVPAYNGRGLAVSLVGSLKWRPGRRFRLKANLRAACQFKAGAPPAPTLNLQLQGDW